MRAAVFSHLCAVVLLLLLGGCPAAPQPDLPDLRGPSDGGLADLAPSVDAALCVPPQASRSPPAAVAVLPDEGLAPYLATINKAQRSLRVFSYLMGSGDVLDALKQKAMAGLSVRVILDQGQSANQKYATQLTDAGATVLWSDPRWSYMHAKVLIADDSEATVSTGNYSAYYNGRERNFVVTLRDPVDLKDLSDLFEADWARKEPSLGCTRLLVSPINSKARLLLLVRSARKTLIIESMQFAETELRGAVAERKAAGVDVRVLLADPSWITANTAAAAFLQQQGIPVRWLASPDAHVKALVVDADAEGLAYAGSENLSYTSLTRNREVGVILSEPAAVKTIRDTFEKDWATGKAF